MTDDQLEDLAGKAGMYTDLFRMGAASMVYSPGCHGVNLAELKRFVALITADADTLLAASRAEVERLRTEVKELTWHRDPWISALDQVPQGRDPVVVISQGWDKPKVLSYEIRLLKDGPWERFIDNDTGRWYWYPERMHWMHLPDYSDLSLTSAALSTNPTKG